MKILSSYKYTLKIKKKNVSHKLEENICTIYLTKDLYAKYIFQKVLQINDKKADSTIKLSNTLKLTYQLRRYVNSQ